MSNFRKHQKRDWHETPRALQRWHAPVRSDQMFCLQRVRPALPTLMSQEWSFQYFEDTWNDPTISGIIRCAPKQMSGRRLGFSQLLVDNRVDQFQPCSAGNISTTTTGACWACQSLDRQLLMLALGRCAACFALLSIVVLHATRTSTHYSNRTPTGMLQTLV